MQQALAKEEDHPLAGTNMTGSDIIVQVLAQEGTDVIFGYSGGAILPTYDAVFRFNAETNESMPLIVPANEQGYGIGLCARKRQGWCSHGDFGSRSYQYSYASS